MNRPSEAKEAIMKSDQRDNMKQRSEEEINKLIKDAVAADDLFEIAVIAKKLHFDCRYEFGELIFTAASEVFRKKETSVTDLLYTLGVLNSTHHNYGQCYDDFRNAIQKRVAEKIRDELQHLPAWLSQLINQSNQLDILLYHYNR